MSADELESALARAEDAQLDQAVKDGDLTKEQADAIKKHRKRSGRVLGLPGGPHGGPGFEVHRGHAFGPPGFGGPGGVLDAVADELGISCRSSSRSCATARRWRSSPRRTTSRSTT